MYSEAKSIYTGSKSSQIESTSLRVTDKEGTIASENLGWRLENNICVELLLRCKTLFRDLFYFKNARHEVDFVVSDGGKPVELIKVSYDISTQKTSNRELNGLLAGAKALKCDKLTLITFNTAETVSINGHTIEIFPAIDWLCQCYEERQIPE